jgi:hypothetical protein
VVQYWFARVLAMDEFITILRQSGWTEGPPWTFRKGTWQLVFDTSSWIEVGTEANARVFDVPVPEPGLQGWCLKLIEHLCATDDQLRLLGQATPPL